MRSVLFSSNICIYFGSSIQSASRSGFSNTCFFFLCETKILCSEWIAVGQDFGNLCRNAFCFSAAIAACGKAAQWQWAMKLFRRRLTDVFPPFFWDVKSFWRKRMTKKVDWIVWNLNIYIIHWKEFASNHLKDLNRLESFLVKRNRLATCYIGRGFLHWCNRKIGHALKNHESTVKKNVFDLELKS